MAKCQIWWIVTHSFCLLCSWCDPNRKWVCSPARYLKRKSSIFFIIFHLLKPIFFIRAYWNFITMCAKNFNISIHGQCPNQLRENKANTLLEAEIFCLFVTHTLGIIASNQVHMDDIVNIVSILEIGRASCRERV
jgi:hypothetical protein